MADEFSGEFYLSQEELDKMISKYKNEEDEEKLEHSKEKEVLVRKVNFEELSQSREENSDKIDYKTIGNVPVELRAVLGTKKEKIENILEIETGTVISLDKMAGEPAEIKIGDVLIAYGEINVIDDDHYVVSITEIASQAERIKTIQKK